MHASPLLSTWRVTKHHPLLGYGISFSINHATHSPMTWFTISSLWPSSLGELEVPYDKGDHSGPNQTHSPVFVAANLSLCPLIPSLHSPSALVPLLSLIFSRDFLRELRPKLFSHSQSVICALEMVDLGKEVTWSYLSPFTCLRPLTSTLLAGFICSSSFLFALLDQHFSLKNKQTTAGGGGGDVCL